MQHATLTTTIAAATLLVGCPRATPTSVGQDGHLPASITITGVAQNPEGIEFDEADETFLLSSVNAGPILKVHLDGTYEAFTNGEPFPLSTAGLQIDRERGRLLAAGFNGTELMDEDPATRGASFLRIYDLKTGAFERDVNLSGLLPDAYAYFANDIAVDGAGNAYVSDWFAGVVYRVDVSGQASVFWTNTSVVPGGPNGLDYHPDGYLLVSLLNDPSYSKHALVRVPVDDPSSAVDVTIADSVFSGFDGMVILGSGAVIGVTNNGTQPGGNLLLKLVSDDGWTSASVRGSTPMPASTTVAVTPDASSYVINQDFTDGAQTTWTIQQVALP